MRKKYVFSLAILLAASALSGCGKKDSSSSYEKYVTLGDYTGMTIDRIKTTVTDEDVLNELKELDVSTLTPLDALNTIYRLQNKLKNRW